MRISLAKHGPDHFDADGRCQCGTSCCVHPMDGTCVCRGCVCQQTPKTSPEHGLCAPYTGAYAGRDYRITLQT